MSTTLDPSTTTAGPGTTPAGRGWVLAGLGAGVLGIVGGVASGMVDAVYDPDVSGDPPAMLERLSEQGPESLGFHTATMVSCVLLVLFAVGLHRQLLARTAPGSLVPGVAVAGLGLVAVAQLLGAGLTTEFAFALVEDEHLVLPESAVFFNHWIGTIPWLWGGAGLVVLGLLAWLFSRRRRPEFEPRRQYDTAALAAGIPGGGGSDDLFGTTSAGNAVTPLDDNEPVPPPRWTSAPATAVPMSAAPTWHGGTAAGPAAATAVDVADSSQKLELARAYLDLGDDDAARTVLREVLDGRDPVAREAAAALLRDL